MYPIEHRKIPTLEEFTIYMYTHEFTKQDIPVVFESLDLLRFALLNNYLPSSGKFPNFDVIEIDIHGQ